MTTTTQHLAQLRRDLKRLESQAPFDTSLRGEVAYLRAEIRRLEKQQRKQP